MKKLVEKLNLNRGPRYWIDSIHLHHEDEVDQVQMLPEWKSKLEANITTVELYVYSGPHAERLTLALLNGTIVTREWLEATKEEIGG